MIAFIDAHRRVHGVEPICRVLPIAPSTYYAHVARRSNPDRLSARAQRDSLLGREISRIWDENFGVYGVRKVWRQLRRGGNVVARCTTARLMRQMGLSGAVRGRAVKTTISNPAMPCPRDKVNRRFHSARPNALWLSDFTYVGTWRGFVYVAFVIDVFARRIVGWRVSCSADTGFVLDALEQALHERRPFDGNRLVHHSDRGSQYVSIRYTERLAEAGIEPSVGSVGDSCDNALARDSDRPVQDRGDPSARAVAHPRGGGVRNSRMGRLVQQPPSPRADREHPSCRGRSALLCTGQRVGDGCLTQTEVPPGNTARSTTRRAASRP